MSYHKIDTNKLINKTIVGAFISCDENGTVYCSLEFEDGTAFRLTATNNTNFKIDMTK